MTPSVFDVGTEHIMVSQLKHTEGNNHEGERGYKKGGEEGEGGYKLEGQEGRGG